jgi:hypothetical protein
MIDDLDEALRQLLIRELPVKNGEIDIAFDQPKREWSARLSRPTLNLFLYDLAENKKLRPTQPMWEIERDNNGNATKRRRDVRIDLKYVITAWAAEPEDEHRLLTRTLMALFRSANMPEDVLPESLRGQQVPIPLVTAQEEDLVNPSDLWSALDNEWRPSITCILTLALNPYLPEQVPLVRTRELRTGQTAGLPQLVESSRRHTWTVGGQIRSDQPLANLRLTVVERGREAVLLPGDYFVINNLQPGDYTLGLWLKAARRAVIPSACRGRIMNWKCNLKGGKNAKI